MEAGVSLVKTNQKDTVQRLVIAAVRAAQRWSWRGSTHPPHGDEQRPQGVVQPQDGTNKLAPKVTRGYRTKTCKIPPRPRPQVGVARHHPCSTGAHLLNYCRRKKRSRSKIKRRPSSRNSSSTTVTYTSCVVASGEASDDRTNCTKAFSTSARSNMSTATPLTWLTRMSPSTTSKYRVGGQGTWSPPLRHESSSPMGAREESSRGQRNRIRATAHTLCKRSKTSASTNQQQSMN
jgi:hypothetical protein